jgi:hypothetical protein
VKIGILTYHRALNYGALFQAYALQTFLQQQGHEVEIVDYWPKYHIEEYRLFPHISFREHSYLGKVKLLLKFCFGLRRILKRRAGYFRFMHKQLALPQLVRYSTGESITGQYDLVVYGSDQIWRKQDNVFFKGFDNVYLGTYPQNTKRRISYAASMGLINLTVKERAHLKRMLNNFAAVSVRETNLQEVMEQLGYNSSIVLDPIFLLTKKEWRDLYLNERILPPRKYILFYHLIISKDAMKLVKFIQEYYGYDVIEIRNVVEPSLIGRRYRYQTASPELFLLLLQNAELIVSTSFHGTAFSLIFEKQFYTTGMGENSERSRSLLKLLDIEKRYIDHIKDVNLKEMINYVAVNKKLIELQVESKKFLQKNITLT